MPVLHLELVIQSQQPGIEHSLSHSVGIKIAIWLPHHVIFFFEVQFRRISTAGAHRDHDRLRLKFAPEPEHVGIDLLIDNPLLALVVQAKISRPGPCRELINPVKFCAFELQKILLLNQVAIFRIDDRNFRALPLQVGNQMPAQKTGAAGDQYFHNEYSDKSTMCFSRCERPAASITACCRSKSDSKALFFALSPSWMPRATSSIINKN